MKVKTYVELADEVEIDIDPTELIRELPGCYPTGEESIHAIQAMVSRCWRCLKAVPDGVIGQFTDEARRKTAEALREQAARFEKCAEPEEMKA